MTKCQGCGVSLQTKNENSLGYTLDINNNLCERCFKLKHYGEYKKVSLTNKEYLKIINSIPKDALIIYTSDILTLDFNFVDTFPNLIYVVTKRDIMPKSIKDEKIISYIYHNCSNPLDVIITSSKNNYQLDKLYYSIIKHQKDNDIYLIGNTNSGKSSLLNKLIACYSDSNSSNVTTSMYPSTTLDKIIIHFDKFNLIDTPGLIDETNITNYLSPFELKKVTPKKEIKPKTCQVSKKGSILIDKFARIDYQTNNSNSFVIYASNNLDIKFASKTNKYLTDNKAYKFEVLTNNDIVIPGLGFIKFTKPINITVYSQDGVVPYLRPNLI